MWNDRARCLLMLENEVWLTTVPQLFIRGAGGITAREGKTVYIRKEYHDRILKIVRVIGGNELSLFSYLDNVLEHHFALFQEEITILTTGETKGYFSL